MTIPYGPLLVVEDVPNILELLEVTLRFKGYPVITATNGQEALDLIQKQHPALVITDILMPRMDGYALVHSMRKNPLTSQIPVIFLSATFITAEDKNFALSLGAVRFLEKPVDTEDFLLTIGEVLTEDLPTRYQPMGEKEFIQGYRQRLESKLQHKNTQIARTQHVLETLGDDQKPAFEALLRQAISDRDEIQEELNQLFLLLDQFKGQGSQA
jgi:CheY-like chemotaxis protein